MTDQLADFDSLLDAAWKQAFQGWDFGYLRGRWKDQDPSWHYRGIVEEAMKQASSMLDMGTGGGEFLASLSPLPPQTLATESWLPNVPIAKQRLEPLGVRVYALESDGDLNAIPDASLDLVINRHEFYLPSEVYRVLKTGGSFITQQVGDKDTEVLNTLLGIPKEAPDWNLASATKDLREAGFKLEREEEEFPILSFFDVGAVVYFCKVIEWQFEGFDIVSHREALWKITQSIEAEGKLDVAQHRFFIVVKK